MHHVFDGAKLFISNTCCRLQPGIRTSPHTSLDCTLSSSAGSQTATNVRNKKNWPVKNMAHITMKGFIVQENNCCRPIVSCSDLKSSIVILIHTEQIQVKKFITSLQETDLLLLSEEIKKNISILY